MGLKRIILTSFVLVVAIISSILYINKPQDFSSFIGAIASVENYEQQSDVGYITVDFGRFNKSNSKEILKVVDKELQSKLQQQSLSDVIGINMTLTIPAKEFKKTHIDREIINDFDLLSATDQYDEYITVTNISIK